MALTTEPSVTTLGDAVLALRDAERRRPIGQRTGELNTGDQHFTTRLTIYTQVSGQDRQRAFQVVRDHYLRYLAAREAVLLEEDVHCAIERARSNYDSEQQARREVLMGRLRAANRAYTELMESLGINVAMTVESSTNMHRAECPLHR
jgi:hypothetical protein